MSIFKNLNNKTKAYGTLLIFLAFSFIFWKYSDAFTTWCSISDPLIVTIAYIVLNPAYIVLIYWLWKEYSFRGAISGLIISIAIDIMSLAHSILLDGKLVTGITPLQTYTDTTFYKIITAYIAPSPFAVFLLYVIIPTALIYLALRIIRKTSSFNKIVRESI